MNGTASLLALTLLGAGAGDPRIPLVWSQLADGPEAALTEVERLRESDRELAGRIGLDYLRGSLLARLEQHQRATDAFLETLSATPDLSLYSYYQLAVEYERLGHPEMAAGLVAKVVAAGRAFPDVAAATRLLRRALSGGGDCRLLGKMGLARLPRAERREVELARAQCALASGEEDRARALLSALLGEERGDEPARQAAELLAEAGLVPEGPSELARRVGLAFHEHRQFARSNPWLDRCLAAPEGGPGLPPVAEFDSRYARARNDFWLGSYPVAAAGFVRLAEAAPDPRRRADAFYQLGRSQELAGDWQGASASYRRAYLAEPRSSWGGGGLLAALRLEWRSGSETTALELYELLLSQRGDRDYVSRAALFLATSDLVRGRGDRAGPWLAQAERSGGASRSEVAYWQGRLAEIEGRPAAAVAAYVEALRPSPLYPFAREARRRLERPSLAAEAEASGIRLAASGQLGDLTAAWLLLGESHPRGKLALTSLALRLRQDRQARSYLLMSPVPVEEWPLWRAPLEGPEERLLALGLWREGAPAVGRHFPVSNPALAFTGSLHLAAAGESRRALELVEILDQRRPAAVPDRLLTEPFRQLLYPFPFRDLIFAAAATHGVDPFLLAALIREESRFDPRAVSAASARGLTQMTHPTAQRLAPRIGRREIGADDLYRPEVSIPLGAAHLAELDAAFHGADHVVIAAYNAGEDPARLWLSHCFSKEPAEYLSKVGFRQTRAYVRKVLASREQYREIYGLGPRLEEAAEGRE